MFVRRKKKITDSCPGLCDVFVCVCVARTLRSRSESICEGEKKLARFFEFVRV